ncbi:helix-turn-helix domain-containing protein [Lacinutrix cladophorae]
MFVTSTYSQQNNLLIKADEVVYANPDEAIKIAEHILNISSESQIKAAANLIIGKSYLTKGDYNKAAIFVFNEVNQSQNIGVITQVDAYLLKSKLLRTLYLDKQSQENLFKAEALVSSITNKKTKDSLQYSVAMENIYMQLNRRQNEEALSAIEATSIKFKDFLNEQKDAKIKIALAKEMAFSQLSKFDIAATNMDNTLVLLNAMEVNNLNEKTIIYRELGELHLQEKNFKQSEETLFIALRFAEIIDNPVLLMQINRDLAINYLATNQKNKYKVYNDEFLVLNNKVELMEQKSINTVFNLITKQQEKVVITKKEEYNKYRNLMLFGFLFILSIGVFMLLKNLARKKRLKEIIKYLEVSRNQFSKPKQTKRKRKKRIVIPEETENTILSKLKRFENSQKFLNKEMSLAVLAGQFETNTKYLSEIINKHYNDNFNTFINKLRLNYIIDKLKTEPSYINYKISFLAEESGYSSHSSFATVFKSIIGMSPATFINLIKEEREELKQKKQNDKT